MPVWAGARRRVDHHLTHLRGADPGSQVRVEVDDEDLDLEGVQRLGEPALGPQRLGGGLVGQCEDQPSAGPVAAERDELERVPCDLAALPALERALAGEHLHKHGLVGGDAVDVGGGAAGQREPPRRQLHAELVGDRGQDQRLGI